jgi:hypothetical protein
MPRVLLRSTVVIVGLGMTLVGCAAAPLVDQLPANIGLPAGTPARPATPYQYPAVHDMPPPRATAPLSEEQQFKLEQELQSARDHQEGRTVAGKPTAQKANYCPARRRQWHWSQDQPVIKASRGNACRLERAVRARV